jgi:hypothetical protein
MKIIQHRGQEGRMGDWQGSYEIDVRAQDDGALVLSHEIDRGGMAPLSSFLDYWHQRNLGTKNFLAINIKEDGLASLLSKLLTNCGVSSDQFFCFDMAQPEIPIYLKEGLPIATRASQYGIEHPMGKYIWFDWYPHVTIHPSSVYQQLVAHLTLIYMDVDDLKIIATSPELHDEVKVNVKDELWSFAKDHKFWGICTKRVEEAEAFFHGN